MAKRKMSKEARERIAAAQRTRWAHWKEDRQKDQSRTNRTKPDNGLNKDFQSALAITRQKIAEFQTAEKVLVEIFKNAA